MKRASRRSILGIAAVVLFAVVLGWSARLGTAKPHVTVTPPPDHAGDLAYTRPLAETAASVGRTPQTVRSWSFDRSLPARWRLSAGARAAGSARATTVTTGETADIQLRSDVFKLPRGTYWLLADGTVRSGGLQLGIEAGDGVSCRTAGYFDRRSVTAQDSTLKLRFDSDGSLIRIVLGNWIARNRPSVWALRRVRIVPVAHGARRSKVQARYAADASPLVQPGSFPVVNLRFRWSFARGVPTDLLFPAGARARRTRAGLLVLTTRERYGFIFTTQVVLGRGPYLLRFEGKILRGGVSLGALDAKTNTWIAQRFYWSGQSGERGSMGLPFSLGHSATIALVVGNWAPQPARSKWLVRRLELDQRF
jgi:hypothetical protein